MINEELKKLWVSIHLLYPNSSQARDVFLTMIENQNSEQFVFVNNLEKLFQKYKKSKIFKAQQGYGEFSQNQLALWKKLNLKGTSDEILIVLSVLGFDLKLDVVAQALKINESKVNYLLKQALKKVLNPQFQKLEFKNDFRPKSFYANETSHFFVVENLVEFTLGHADQATQHKIEKKINETNIFNDYKIDIQKFKNEICYLVPTEVFEQTVLQFDNLKKQNNKFKKQFKLKYINAFYGKIILLGITIATLGFIVVKRPEFVKKIILNKSEKTIVVTELSVKKSENQSANAGKDQSIQAEKIEINSAAKAKNMAAETINISSPDDKTIKEITRDGFYKISIKVIDFDILKNVIKDKIVSLGGKKAGEIELGWIKNNNLAYYHFLIPTDAKEEIIKYLKGFSEFKLVYEKNPRLNEANHERIVLEVLKNE